MLSTKALINQLRVPDAIETDVRFVDRAEPSHHRFGMTRMEGLRISYEQKMSQAGRTEDGQAASVTLQERSFDFYGQLAIAARLYG